VLRVILDDNNDFPVGVMGDDGVYVPGGPVLGTGIDSYATAVRSVLSVQAGEWPFDLTFGTRYRSVVLVKYFDAAATRAMLAATINTVPDSDVPVTPAQITIDTVSLADVRQANITVDDVVIDGETVDTLNFTTTI